MNRLICALVLCLFIMGCSQPTETVPTVTGTGGNSGTSAVTDDLELDTSSEAPPSGDGASIGSFPWLQYS